MSNKTSSADRVAFRKLAAAHRGYALYRRKDRSASYAVLLDGVERGEVRGLLGGGYAVVIDGKRVAGSSLCSLKFAK